MELKVINRKQLKKIYINFLTICLVITAGSFILFRSGFQFYRGNEWVIDMKNLFLYGMLGVILTYTVFQMSQRKKMQALPTVDEKIVFFEKFYRNRLWWQVFGCLFSGFLLLLTSRAVFFYIGLFDLFGMFIAYPSEFMIKKEMKEDDLLFVN